jgi:hypothetical protein
MSLFGNGKMGWDSLGRSAGDCVNAGVGGSLDGAGAVEPGGVLPRDLLLVCNRDICQYMTTSQTVILPIHETERPSVTRCCHKGSHDTS